MHVAVGGGILDRMASKRKRVGRPRAEEQKRDHRVVVILTAEEHATFVAEAQELGVPTYLYSRWLLTRHPIPQPAPRK